MLSESEAREFEQFWRQYPRRVGKGEARKAWQQTRAIRPPLSALLAAVVRYIAWREDLTKRGDFVPAIAHPSTWLRAERWDDEFDAVAERPWHETATGIEAKGRELGIDPDRYPNFPAFRAAVHEAVRLSERPGNVVPLSRRRA